MKHGVVCTNIVCMGETCGSYQLKLKTFHASSFGFSEIKPVFSGSVADT